MLILLLCNTKDYVSGKDFQGSFHFRDFGEKSSGKDIINEGVAKEKIIFNITVTINKFTKDFLNANSTTKNTTLDPQLLEADKEITNIICRQDALDRNILIN